MRKIVRGYDRLLEICGELPGFIVVLVVIGISSDVALRNLGLGGIEWMIETVEYALYTLTFVGAAYVLKIGRHVTVDVLVASLSDRARRRVAAVAAAIMLIICMIFLYYWVRVVLSAEADDSLIIKTFTIPEWVLLSLLPPTALLLCIECLRRLVGELRATGEPPSKQIMRDGL